MKVTFLVISFEPKAKEKIMRLGLHALQKSG